MVRTKKSRRVAVVRLCHFRAVKLVPLFLGDVFRLRQGDISVKCFDSNGTVRFR
jgi:hypothetical protein